MSSDATMSLPDRFAFMPGRVEKTCRGCGRAMWLAPNAAKRYTTCGGECSKKARAAVAEARKRNCETCHTEFIPRPRQLRLGWGRYCSVKCNAAGQDAAHAPASVAKRVKTFKERYAAGLFKLPSGPAYWNWRGGHEAARHRANARIRRYRAAHPEKRRQWSKVRAIAQRKSLPPGTIEFLGESQRWRCVGCRCCIRLKFHLDHIVALASGGLHEVTNLQLLCPRCNAKKGKKHPIDFMQSKGFLL